MRKLYYKNIILNKIGLLFESKRLFSPIQLAILTLKQMNLWPGELIALDPFCQTGTQWTRQYANEAKYLELWDIEEEAVKYARKQYPNAIVRCGDSISAILNGSLNRTDYNFICLDTPVPFCVDHTHYEHFMFFESTLNLLTESGILILNVVPNIHTIQDIHPLEASFVNNWKIARSKFYETADGIYVNPEIMVNAYRKKCLANNFEVKYINYQARNKYLGIVIIAVEKAN